MSQPAALARAPRDVAAEEGALRARLAFVRRLASQLADGRSVAAQALAAYDDILDGACVEIGGEGGGGEEEEEGALLPPIGLPSAARGGGGACAISLASFAPPHATSALTCAVWRWLGGLAGACCVLATSGGPLTPTNPSLTYPPPPLPPQKSYTTSPWKPTAAPAPAPQAPRPPPTMKAPPPPADGARAHAPPAASRASHAAVDVFGAPLRATGGGGGGGGGGDVECTQCGRRVAASRFAPHLEKCLGGGRAAGRAASRRQYAE